MAKNKSKDTITDLLRRIDEELVKDLQDLSRQVLSGNLPDRKNILTTGSFQGIERARTIIAKTYKVWQQGDEDDDDSTP